MKKILVSLSLALTAGLSSAFARNDPDPDQHVLDLFKKEFAAAQNVTWAKEEEFDKVTFLLGDSRVIAYFNPDGELEGYVRDILFEQLPIAVMKAVDKRFANADVYTVREINNAEGTIYRITLQANNRKYNIKVGASGNIRDIEKLRK